MFVSGNSKEWRIVILADCLNLSFRFANLTDAELLYKWRCSKEVAEYMLGNPPHDFNQHVNWLTNSLDLTDKIILIVHDANTPIGIITYCNFSSQSSSVEFGWYIGNLNYREKGFSKYILQMIFAISQKIMRVNTLKCVVLKKNVIANHIYSKFGFELISEDNLSNYLQYKIA